MTSFEVVNMIDLNELYGGAPGISPEWGGSLAKCAGVSFEAQGHKNPTQVSIKGEFKENCQVKWPDINNQDRRSWNDLEEAAEYGAYGIASLLVSRHTDLEVVERSYKGTGFDYWLGQKGQTEPLFQKKARLEVSGIQNGTENTIQTRVRAKVKQTLRTTGALPAYVVVVEYSQPQVRVAKDE